MTPKLWQFKSSFASICSSQCQCHHANCSRRCCTANIETLNPNLLSLLVFLFHTVRSARSEPIHFWCVVLQTGETNVSLISYDWVFTLLIATVYRCPQHKLYSTWWNRVVVSVSRRSRDVWMSRLGLGHWRLVPETTKFSPNFAGHNNKVNQVSHCC